METLGQLPALYSEREVADYLQISVITLARYRKAGEIACIMVGSTPRYSESHIKEYLESRNHPAKIDSVTEESTRLAGQRSKAGNVSVAPLQLAHEVLKNARRVR